MEFRHYEKTAGWYITLTALAILITAFFVIQKDIFAAATTVIMSAFVLFFSRQTPKMVDIRLTGQGIEFDNIFFPYKQLKYFWIVNNQHHQTVNFHTNTYINNTIILELEGQNPDEIRAFLLGHLSEHEEVHETFVQRISHKLKF